MKVYESVTCCVSSRRKEPWWLSLNWRGVRLGRESSGTPNERFLSNAFKHCFRLSGVLSKLCRLILGCAKFCLFGYARGIWVFSNLLGLFCPFPENVRSYRLSENDSWLFFGTQNDIFNNLKATDIKFLISRKYEVTTVTLNRWEWTKYHRFRALNIPKHEHSTSGINTTKSALACSHFFFLVIFTVLCFYCHHCRASLPAPS